MPNKTKPTTFSVTEFLNNYPNQNVIPDCFELITLYEKVTGQKPVMWSTMVGFGSYHYKYESGREGDIFVVGFAPSKVGITLYTMAGYKDQQENLAQLGKHKIGKACLYIKKLDDLDLSILEKIIDFGYKHKSTLYENN